MNAVQYDRPDLEEVLRDIAKSPKSKLLRVPKARDVVRAMRDEPVGVAAAGLTSAERHLLQVHREEVAYLLQERCVMQIFTPEDATYHYDWSITCTRVVTFPTESDWASRTSGVVDSLPAHGIDPSVCELLVGCVSGRRIASVDQLARACQRVSGAPQAYLYESLEQVQAGSTVAATDLCKRAVEEAGPFIASFGFQNAGMAFLRAGDPARAREAYSIATRMAPFRPTLPMNWLVASVLGQDLGECRLAASRLEDLVDSCHTSINEFTRLVRWHMSPAGPLELGQEAMLIVRRMLREAGPTSTRILNALID